MPKKNKIKKHGKKSPAIAPQIDEEDLATSTNIREGLYNVDLEHPQPQPPNNRPYLRPTSPSAQLQRSSSSILTMSKLYQQQQVHTGSKSPITSNARSSRSAQFLSSKPSSNKKLHKRVLSSSSINDYFSATSHSPTESPSSGGREHSTSPLAQTKRVSPGPVLPTFQKMDSFQDQVDANKGSDLPKTLDQSRIFERRRSRHNAPKLDVEEEAQQEDLDQVLDENDTEVDEKYKEKLNRMKSTKRKNVEFYDDDDTESDVDLDSENDDKHNKKETGAETGSSSNTTTVEIEKTSSSNDNDNDDNEHRGFKGFLRRIAGDELDDIPDRLRRKPTIKPNGDESDDEDNGFFSRFINLGSGGGLAPGAAKDEPRKANDEEAQRQIVSEDGLEMTQLDPRLFAKEAKDIIGAHGRRRNHSKPNPADTSDETTLKDSGSSVNESFLAPNPDLYLRDEDNIYEMNLDDSGDAYVAPPDRVRGGVLSSLLKLYQNPAEASRSKLSLASSDGSPAPSGMTTPTEDHEEFITDKSLAGRLKNFGHHSKKKVAIDEESAKAHRRNASFTDAAQYLSPSFMKNKQNASTSQLPSFSKNRPKNKRGNSSNLLKFKREQAEARITVHIADILQRQRFIIRMCKALMLYGAPTHRLEDYLTMTARVLEIDAQFIYLPGVMIISFGDATTRTSEVQLVRCAQGLNLYKLHRVHRIYKQVIHDLVGVEEASTAIDELLSQKPLIPPWACVILYGIGSLTVTPFAFSGGWIDLPVSFGIGCCVGTLQYFIAPRSNLYSNVFEVTASIVVSFIGRALGSINGANICFSAVVQGSLALILPGYIILCGSLELQSRNLVAGAVRMFYAIIYSLFLGFGISLGAALYGWIDHSATSETTCSRSLDPKWNILFVPAFTLVLCLLNQAKWFQLPIMLFISSVGYVVNYFASKYFYDSTEFTSAMGAFVIGVLGNLYSRIWKGLAASAMLPAIFVQVPGGISSQASLLAGVQNADRLVSNSTDISNTSNTSALSFGVTMVQVAIGISVGLFASTIAVYPFGKKKTSVFTL